MKIDDDLLRSHAAPARLFYRSIVNMRRHE